MKNGLIFLFFLLVLGQSCTDSGKMDDYITIKPGYYCQVGGIAVSGDTIFIAGSYVPVDNPNLTLQPVYSYIGAIDTNGKLIWEHVISIPDYTRWTKIITDNHGSVFAIGKAKSPLNSLVAGLVQISSKYGIEKKGIWVEDSLPHEMADIWITSKGQLAFLRIKEMSGSSMPCINKQVEFFDGSTDYHRNFCIYGTFSCSRFINDTLYFSAWGELGVTEYLYFINDKDSLKQLNKLDGLHGMMVNDIAIKNDKEYSLATTTKNGQGPCVYNVNKEDSITQNICLDYWPMHGSVLMRPIGNCYILAFNAADSTDENAARVVLLDASSKVVYQEKIASTSPFIINDVAVTESSIYLAGTIETDGEGSSMAIKVIPIADSLGCKVVQ